MPFSLYHSTGPILYSAQMQTPLLQFKMVFNLGQSRSLRGTSRGSAAARLLGMWNQDLPAAWQSLSAERSLWLGIGLCDDC